MRMSKPIVWCDFETRSECDLPNKGVYNYAQDLSTDVLCMAYAFGDAEVQLWLPGQPLPDFGGCQIRAHNAAFERLIFWYVLQQEYPLEGFYCTATQARANCAPGSLEDAGRFAGAGMRKDMRGTQLVRQCCLPPFNTDLLPELYAYCLQDVRAMRAVSKGMRELSAQELADYHASERINDRGVLVDVSLADAAVGYAAAELAEVQGLVKDITKGEVTSVRSQRMKAWVQVRVGPRALAMMTQENGKTSADKTVRANLLALADTDPDEVPVDVADVLQCASDIWSSSVAKFGRMSALADVEDHRVRGAFVFNGGAATGRASSYGLQVHNLGRKTAKDPNAMRELMLSSAALPGGVSASLKSMLRPALIPAPGHVFVVADWAGIEARVNPWLAGAGLAEVEAKLDLFRHGRDVYKVNAAATFHCEVVDVTDAQRQIGKVQELACGFGGSVGAFTKMGRVYGVNMPESESLRMVQGWRKANPWAQPYWRSLDEAYTRAMRNKGCEFRAGRVAYMFDGVTLWYALPSGRVLCYPHARLDSDGVSYAKAAFKPKAGAKEWPRARLWHGVACIAKGVPVLTLRGWVAIEDVGLSDRIWDGVEWVSHEGLAYQGVGRVNYAFAVAMTADHLVLTCKGWIRADQTKGHIRATCGLPSGYKIVGDGRAQGNMGDYLRLWSDSGHEIGRLPKVSQQREARFVRVPQKRTTAASAKNARYESAPSIRCVEVYAGSLPVAIASGVEKLRRSWHIRMHPLARVIRELLVGYVAGVRGGVVSGQNRQQRGLFDAKLSVGDLPTTGTQYAQVSSDRQSIGTNVGLRTFRDYRNWANNAAVPLGERGDWSRPDQQTGRYEEVFDLLNCGPRRQFVVRGVDGQPLIVHNCENIAQATANDLLRHTLRQIDGCVLHVHDEVVLEVLAENAATASEQLKTIMCTPPDWATGLPLAVEVKTMQRYGK